MNSLTYLSRQFDVLASPRTPPSTPTSDKPTLLSNFDTADNLSEGHRNNPKRAQTLLPPYTKPPASGAPDHEEARPTKRSFSLPTFLSRSVSRTFSSSLSVPSASSSSAEQKDMRFQQRIRRLYLVRVFITVWNAICQTWRWMSRHRFIHARSHGPVMGERTDTDTEETSVDEKDTEEELDPLGVRSSSKCKMDPDSHPPISPDLDTPPSLLPGHIISTSPIPSPPHVTISPPSPRTHIKSSSLLPNPFSTSPLAQSSPPFQTSPRSSSPTPSLPSTPPSHPRKTPFHLPKTLVLDLDETLIHSTSRPLVGHGTGGTGLLGLGGRRNKGAGHMVEVVLGGRSTLYHVYKRPFVDYFLRKVSGWYTLVIFTASMQEYADPVIDWLDAGRGILSRRLFRESCTQLPSGSYTKDLSLIEEDLSRVCLVDNSPVSYSVNQANGIPIEGWTHDMSDEALLDLLPVLDSLRFTSDVRRVLGMRGF